MSTLPTDALSSPSQPPLEGSVSSPAVFPLLVRTVRKQDLGNLADILASSFHSQEGHLGWLYPLLRTGIYEDLRSRMQNRSKHYACLVVARPVLSAEIEQEEKSKRSLQFSSPILASALTSLADGAVKGNRPIGTIEISLKNPPSWQSPYTRYLYLSNLAVHLDYRRQGAAQQLLQTCDRVALDWGFHDLYLHVLESNYQARRLYLRSGYRLLRVETSLGGWLLGRPRQLFLHKSLRKS